MTQAVTQTGERPELTLLRYIADYRDEYSYSPTIREMMADLGVSSLSVVDYRLQRLEEAGLITRKPKLVRTIVLTELATTNLSNHQHLTRLLHRPRKQAERIQS